MKIISLLIVFLLFNFAIAQEFPARKLPPIIRCGENFFQCLGFFFLVILRIILALSLALATIFIAYAGILYITKSGTEEAKKIHQRIMWAAIGLIVALMSFAFIKSLEFWVSKIEQEERGPLEPPPELRHPPFKPPQEGPLEPPPWLRFPRGPLEPPPELRPTPFEPLPPSEPLPPPESPPPDKPQILYQPKFVLAQIQEPAIPEEITCGPIKLPSVFVKTELRKDVWQICFLYYLTRFLSFFYVLALFLGVVFLSWAGILYITNPEKVGEAHKRLMWGIAGVVVAILSLTLIKMIEIFFLKL